MKTTIEWLQQLPIEYRRKAIANLADWSSTTLEPSLDEALLGAFTFGTTPEGFKYWDDLYTRLKSGEHTDDVKVNKIELASRIAHELLSTRFTAMGIIYEDEDMMEMDGDMSRYREPYQKHFDIEYCKVLTIIEEIKI